MGLHRIGKSVAGNRLTGSAKRFALLFIRFMFMSGRNIVTVPSGCLYAFIPSKSA